MAGPKTWTGTAAETAEDEAPSEPEKKSDTAEKPKASGKSKSA